MNGLSLTGKIIVKGKLKLISPLIIGSGKSNLADIEVLKDESGKPYIPATSFCGVLRHYFEDNTFSNNIQDQSNYFWGIHKKDQNGKVTEIESALICHDLFTENAIIRVRDGIRIDVKKGTAKDEGKYDYEVVEPDAVFDLFWEISIRKAFDKDKNILKKIIMTLISVLERGEISLGAKTNNGFGKCMLTDAQIYEFDFSKKNDVKQWLNQEFVNGISKLDVDLFINQNKTFSIDASFSIKNSFIVRSYPSEPKFPDGVHLTSNGKNVMPGTSFKGAIRNRALRIANTLNIINAEQKIKELFGTAGENETKRKSKVVVEETIIEDSVAELQNRIKIDRFTGGTIKTALFDSMPLWSSNNPESVKIKIRLRDYEPWEAGLLMLVLKDLWAEDLAIGGEKNVGRGILTGNSAVIKWDNRMLIMERDVDKLKFSSESDAKELNDFVNRLLEVK